MWKFEMTHLSLSMNHMEQIVRPTMCHCMYIFLLRSHLKQHLMFPGFLNKRSKNKVKATMCHHHCWVYFYKRQRVPVAAEALKATDHLLNPPPSRWLDTPYPYPILPACLLSRGLDRAPTSDHHKHVGLWWQSRPWDVLYKLTSTTAH